MASHTRLTVDFDRAASAPSSVGQGGFHVAYRQAPHEPGDHQALQGVGPAHPDSEQPRHEGLVGAPQLGPFDGHRPRGGLDRGRTVPVAAAGTRSLAMGVALPAQELGDLGLDGGLHQQAHPEPGHLFEHLAELTLRGEQVVDVSADALDR